MTTPELTLAQAAEIFHKKPRWLRNYVKKHKIPVLKPGRDLLFDDIALSALREAMRCHSPSPGAGEPARLPSAGLSPDAAYAAALKVTIRSLRQKKPGRSRRNSSEQLGTGNVVALEPGQKRKRHT